MMEKQHPDEITDQNVAKPYPAENEVPSRHDMRAESQTGPPALHPAFYIALWISLSSGVIFYNKWILDSVNFTIFVTSWHLAFAAVLTQIMARYTTYLDSRKSVPMTKRTYIRAIVPIGLLYSLSLVSGNVAYLYLSVSFIQMLKAAAPIAVLLSTWAFKLQEPSLSAFGTICIIAIGVAIASFGEIKFRFIGLLYQFGGLVFDAMRLTMIQRLLTADFKMNPLVSLYYFTPVCATTNGILSLIFEAPRMTQDDFVRLGWFTFFASAVAAFLLNLSSLLLNIMIVLASVIFFHERVSVMQLIGFSIALGGLAYYQLGGIPTVSTRSQEAQRSEKSIDSIEAQNLLQEKGIYQVEVGSAEDSSRLLFM